MLRELGKIDARGRERYREREEEEREREREEKRGKRNFPFLVTPRSSSLFVLSRGLYFVRGARIEESTRPPNMMSQPLAAPGVEPTWTGGW